MGEAVSRRSVLTGAAALGGAALLAACGSGGAPSGGASGGRSTGPIMVTDQRGKTLTFDRPVTRVVTLPMPAASMLVAVDRGIEHLVGMHNASWVAMSNGVMGQMFPKALQIPHDVASQDFAPNVESIVALRPDVVVQWGDEGTEITAPLENAGLKVLGLRYGTQEDVQTWIALFATMLGKPERGQEMRRRIDDDLVTAAAEGRKRSNGPSILYFNRFTGGLKVAGHNTYNDFYIRMIGATNPATGDQGPPGNGMVGVDVEQVLAWDPQIVLLGNFDDAVPDDLYSAPVWQQLAAVRSRQVYKVPLGGYRWDPPGQESPLMWRWLSRIAFPQQGRSDLRSVMSSYYEFLYGQRPTEAQMDEVLWEKLNKGSAHYEQFDAA